MRAFLFSLAAMVALLMAIEMTTCHSIQAAEVAQPTMGRVSDVTLYRDSALVTRMVPVAAGNGPREIVIDGLPEQLSTESVFAEGSEAIAIRAVRVVTEPIDGSVREEVKLLDDRLKDSQNELDELDHVEKLTTNHLALLTQLMTFTHKTVQDDLNRGVLNADTLQSMWVMARDEREQLSDRLHSVEQERKEIDAAMEQTIRERSKLTAGTPEVRYRVRIYIDGNNAQADHLRLRYSVSGCRWSPQYVVEGDTNSDQIGLRYGAIIEQLSGEDWNEVQLTLSTASPSVSASGPTLTPLRIAATTLGSDDAEMQDPFGGDPFANSLAPNSPASGGFTKPQKQAMPSQMTGGNVLQSKMLSLRNEQRQVEIAAPSKRGRLAEQQRDLQLNRLAGQMQEIELRASANTARGLASDAGEDVASQTYVLDDPVSLQSRREQQLVEIIDTKFDGELYHTATPLLSSFAYREVELVNSLDIGLLSGPASIYLDDRFVGTMSLPTTASGQLLTIGFGADGQVRTRRELVSKKDSIQGGNRRLQSSYKLVINNFKDTPIQVRLLDRIPVSGQSQQTSVLLGETSSPISEDALYERMRRPLGLLRWDLEIPASRHGSEAFDVTYDYTVEFDRSRTLSVPLTTPEDVTESGISDFFGGGMGGGGGR